MVSNRKSVVGPNWQAADRPVTRNVEPLPSTKIESDLEVAMFNLNGTLAYIGFPGCPRCINRRDTEDLHHHLEDELS
jgi:hypothetical protein